MASGSVQLGSALNFAVNSSSCDDVMLGINAVQFPLDDGFNVLSCSANPVTPGSILFVEDQYGNPVTKTVYSITATPYGEPPTGEPASGYMSEVFLLQAVLVCFLIFMFVKGIDSGNRL